MKMNDENQKDVRCFICGKSGFLKEGELLPENWSGTWNDENKVRHYFCEDHRPRAL